MFLLINNPSSDIKEFNKRVEEALSDKSLHFCTNTHANEIAESIVEHDCYPDYISLQTITDL